MGYDLNDVYQNSSPLLYMPTETLERNINVLKNRQNELKNETEAKYKEVFTDEQYKEYQMLQIKADNAFSDFLRK